jgi:uncharacterized protein
MELGGAAFPLSVNDAGRIAVSGGDPGLRGRIVQVLFTAPGERVHEPEFGCGLLNLVFEPLHATLAPAIEFTIGQALSRWLSDEIEVDSVHVSRDETVLVEVVYTKLSDLRRQALRIAFK